MVSCNFQFHFVLKAYSVYIISEALFFRRPREWKVISWRPVFMVLKGILLLDGGKINTSVKNGRERKRIYLQTSPTCLPARRRQRQDWTWRSKNAHLPTCFRSWRTPHRFHGVKKILSHAPTHPKITEHRLVAFVFYFPDFAWIWYSVSWDMTFVYQIT